MPRRFPALAALVLAALSVAAPARAAGVPRSWFGMVSEDVFAGDAAYRDATLGDEWRAGVGTIRQTFHWAQIEPSKGKFDFSAYDPYVERVAAHGLQVAPILFEPPAWASSKPASGANPGTYPPKDPADMGRFAAALARRYGPGGTFWTAHPALTPVPIRSWQVWNEPNLAAYWPAGVDAAGYTALQQAVASAVRAVDPGATLLSAGLANSTRSDAVPRATYIQQMYAAGAKGSFDALAITRYGQDDNVVAAVRDTRTVMAQAGDPAGIAVSEMGWATGGPRGTATVGEDGQAMDIKCSLAKLGQARAQYGIASITYWNWRDSLPYANDFWGLHTGLLRLDGSRKPGYDAYVLAASRLQSPPPGNQPPRACLLASANRVPTGTTVTLSSTSMDPDGAVAGVAWDLDDDGAFDDGTTAKVSRSWAKAGTYLVRIDAADAAGAHDASAQAIEVTDRLPSASFTWTPASPAVGQSMVFSSTSSDPDGTIASVAWDLDDDGAYDDATWTRPKKTFTTAGSHVVRLKVVDDDGGVATKAATVTVTAP